MTVRLDRRRYRYIRPVPNCRLPRAGYKTSARCRVSACRERGIKLWLAKDIERKTEGMAEEVGRLSARVIELLSLQLQEGQPIYIGDSNISHMKSRHPNYYAKYGQYIPDILSSPDYVGENPADGSIEYVKEFLIGNEYVKVAVRLSNGGVLYTRSLYVLNHNRVMNFIQKGTLKKFD